MEEERCEAALGTDLDQVPRERMLSINVVINSNLRISARTQIISRRGWSRSELYLTMAILEIRQRQQRRFVVRLGNWIFGEGKEGENVDKVGCGV